MKERDSNTNFSSNILTIFVRNLNNLEKIKSSIIILEGMSALKIREGSRIWFIILPKQNKDKGKEKHIFYFLFIIILLNGREISSDFISKLKFAN